MGIRDSKIFWVLVLILIGLLGAAAAFQQVRDALWQAFVGVSEPAANWFAGVSATVATHPLYQQYHWVLWMIAGGITIIAFHQLIQKIRPGTQIPLLSKKKVAAVREEPQDVIISENPASTKKEATAPEQVPS